MTERCSHSKNVLAAAGPTRTGNARDYRSQAHRRTEIRDRPSSFARLTTLIAPLPGSRGRSRRAGFAKGSALARARVKRRQAGAGRGGLPRPSARIRLSALPQLRRSACAGRVSRRVRHPNKSVRSVRKPRVFVPRAGVTIIGGFGPGSTTPTQRLPMGANGSRTRVGCFRASSLSNG
jgi:hypothetical protein